MISLVNNALAVGSVSGCLIVALDALDRAVHIGEAANKRGATIPVDRIKLVGTDLNLLADWLKKEMVDLDD